MTSIVVCGSHRWAVALVVLILATACLLPCNAANNLLVNAGFEGGVPYPNIQAGGIYEATVAGWTYAQLESGGYLGICGEALASLYFAPQPAQIHGGVEALRVYLAGTPPPYSRVHISQMVPVQATQQYTASAYVYTWGTFGQAGDFAGVMVEQYDASGTLIAGGTYSHGFIDAAGSYRQASTTFTTAANTASVKFVLRAEYSSSLTEGSVIFDDAALDGPTAQATVSGTVTNESGAAVAGATVAAGSVSGVTGVDGKYSLPGIDAGTYLFTVTKTGFYVKKKSATVIGGLNTVNFTVEATPANNLLVNPGFEPAVGAHIQEWGVYHGTQNGWNYDQIDEYGYIGIENESVAAPYFAPQPAQIHSGNEAVRVYLGSDPAPYSRVHISQMVPVQANAQYTASAFVYAWGTFGQAGDFAGVTAEQYDASGTLIPGGSYSHGFTVPASSYRRASTTFTTAANTAFVKFALRAENASVYNQGSVIFDDAALDGPTTLSAVVSGTITNESGTAVAGATVAAGGASDVTDGDGKYSLPPINAGATTFTVTKTGYYVRTKSVQLAQGIGVVNLTLDAAPANNLLLNPGFESGVPVPNIQQWDIYEATVAGWNYAQLDMGGYLGVCGEAFASIYFAPQPAQIHSGNEAMRTYLDAIAPFSRIHISQMVPVRANAQYRASAFAYTWGTFGQAGDFAGVMVEQYNASGGLIAGGTYSNGFTDPSGNYRRASRTFTTAANTAFVKFTLRAEYDSVYNQGSVIFDDAALDGPSPLPATISGTVTSALGSPIRGASVSAAGISALTGSDGVYTLPNIVPTPSTVVTATKIGFGSESKTVVLVPGAVNPVDFVLQPQNLLSNPGFEEGVPYPSIQVGGIYEATVAGWTYAQLESGGYLGICGEAFASLFFAPQPAQIHSGNEALRTYIVGAPFSRIHISQMVPVVPGVTYAASGYVYTWGTFGQAGDFAGVMVEQYDASSNLIAGGSYSDGFTDPVGSYRQASKTFTTAANAAYVKYVLRAEYASLHNQGSVIFDETALYGPPAGTYMPTVAAAKAAADGTVVQMSGKVVTCAFSGFFYIEEPDRSAGIKVLDNYGLVPGDRITIVGAIRTQDGERVIEPAFVQKTSTGDALLPLGMNNRGAWTDLATGLYAVVWGRVDAIGGNPFTMTDGSGNSLRVYGPSGYSATPGDYVRAEGALGSESGGIGRACHAVSVVPQE